LKILLYTLLSSALILTTPQKAKADIWGGDLVYLSQLLIYAIQQYEKVKEITQHGEDTLNELKEVNRGLKRAFNLRQTLNKRLKAGTFSNIHDVRQLIRTVEDLYGKIPKTTEAEVHKTTDITIAEGIHMHNQAFKYADELDPEAERLKRYGQSANQKSAIKASVQGQGMIIHVLNQILRTNAALLKMQSQNLAMDNRRSKIEAGHYRKQYKSLGKAFDEIKSDFNLLPIRKQN